MEHVFHLARALDPTESDESGESEPDEVSPSTPVACEDDGLGKGSSSESSCSPLADPEEVSPSSEPESAS